MQMGNYTLEHRPKKGGGGIGYHLNEIRHAFGLLRTARAFGADIAFLDTGSMPIHTMFLFRLFGIRWYQSCIISYGPHIFRRPGAARALCGGWTDSSGAIGVSPECEKQVRMEAPNLHYSIVQVRAQFRSDYFA